MNSMHKAIIALSVLDRNDKDFDAKFAALQDAARAVSATFTGSQEGSVVYVAGPMGCTEARDFTLGPAPAIWELGEIPDGHVIASMTSGGKIVDRAVVINGVANWTYLIEQERRTAADYFYEDDAELGEVVNDSGWRTDGDNSMSKTIFCDEGGKDTVKRTLSLVFAPKSAVITSALFDGEELPLPEQQANADIPEL